MNFINRKSAVLGIGLLSMSGLLAVSQPAEARPRNNDSREERREWKEARKEVKRERKDVRKAESAAERRQELRELRDAQERLRRERQDIREERREDRGGRWNNRPTWNRPAYNAPRPAYNSGYGSGYGAYDQNDFRQFNGYSLGNTSGDTFQVRADNGTTYTVRSTAYSQRGERVTVSGYLVNGVIINARVNRY
ncbi:MAG TPA: hypothetical protein VF681_00410 [Abditibacteriaceae bacterium]|jgi:hypothetical protein